MLDVVVHEEGLVTEWAQRRLRGRPRSWSPAPKGSFEPPADAAWLLLVGDLTAMPAMARIAETVDGRAGRRRIWAEVPDDLTGYLPDGADVTWLDAARPRASRGWPRSSRASTGPTGEGYFWMAGESAQMRAIRKHLMRERRLPSTAYDVMGYWRAVAAPAAAVGRPRADLAGGKAAGKRRADLGGVRRGARWLSTTSDRTAAASRRSSAGPTPASPR